MSTFRVTANQLEQLGFIKPEVSDERLGLFTGTKDDLTMIPIPDTMSATTLEELEERPIVIEQTNKTDET